MRWSVRGGRAINNEHIDEHKIPPLREILIPGHNTPLENLKLILSQADSQQPRDADQLISKDLIRAILKKIQELPGESISEEDAHSLLMPLMKTTVDELDRT